MPERRRRYSLHEVQYNVATRGEGGVFELYHPLRSRDRRVIVIKETPVHSRKKQRLERSRSLTPVRGRQRERERLERPRSPPPERRRRRAPSLEPVRIPSPPRNTSIWDRSIFSVMSPKMPQATFVPLPPKLEKDTKSKDKDKDKDKKSSSKDKKSKNEFFWDDESSSNRSNRSSPFYETRSPEDYSPRTKAKKYSQDDRQYEIVMPSLGRPTSRNGNSGVWYETREPRSMPDRKLKKVEDQSRVFQEALLDAEDVAQHNLQAAKSEEFKRQSAEVEIGALKDQIRKLTVQVDNANERATRAEIEADKVRENQIREARSRLGLLEQRQWREIEGSQKPLPSRPLARRSTLPVSGYTTVTAAPVGHAALEQIQQEYQSRNKPDEEPYIMTSGQGRQSRRGRRGEGAWR